jgi:hypothetical protein
MSLFWRELADVEVDHVVADLEEWVNWLRRTNRRLGEIVQDCWPNHSGVVLQLAAWQEWWWGIYAPALSVHRDGDKMVAGTHSGQQALMWWESLERAENRLANEFRGCQRGNCKLDKESGTVADADESERWSESARRRIAALGAGGLRDYFPGWAD